MPDVELASLEGWWFVQVADSPDALCIHHVRAQALECARRLAGARAVDLRIADADTGSRVERSDETLTG